MKSLEYTKAPFRWIAKANLPYRVKRDEKPPTFTGQGISRTGRPRLLGAGVATSKRNELQIFAVISQRCALELGSARLVKFCRLW